MIDLHDSDIARIDEGPLAWMKSKQATSMNLEDFRRAVTEKFADIGFDVKVKPYETTEVGTYAWDVDIIGRNSNAKEFDPDRLVHEITHNLLDLKGVKEGPIKTDKGVVRELLNGGRPDSSGKHHH